jgi:hypothetical protein
LGDGYIRIQQDPRCPNALPSATLCVKHCARQAEYAEHKADLLHCLLGGAKPKISPFDNSGHPGVMFAKTNKYFRILKKRLYRNGHKFISRQILDYLTDEGLAIWWMDDGSLYMKRRNGIIHAREGILSTYCSKSECETVADWFRDRYGIVVAPVAHKRSFRIRINTANLKLLVPIIAPHVVPCLSYKIDMKYDLEL